jgi:hypothetical protein
MVYSGGIRCQRIMCVEKHPCFKLGGKNATEGVKKFQHAGYEIQNKPMIKLEVIDKQIFHKIFFTANSKVTT